MFVSNLVRSPIITHAIYSNKIISKKAQYNNIRAMIEYTEQCPTSPAKTKYFQERINLILSETKYSLDKNNLKASPAKFRIGHRTIKANNGKKIKSEGVSPNHQDQTARQSATARKNVNLKTQSLLTERNVRKNSIKAIMEKKFNGGATGALGNHSPEKIRIRARGMGLIPDQNDSKAKQGNASILIMSSTRLSRNQSSQLTNLEQEQTKKFPLYFAGARRVSHRMQFTDSDGNVLVKKGDSVAYRYQILQLFGKGAFGKVYRAFDHKKSEEVALKIIKSIPKLNQQAKIQVDILEKAIKLGQQKNCNIVRMKGSFVFRGHTCITYEIMHKNLYEYMKQKQFKPIPEKIMAKFSVQILQALDFLSSQIIVHCDIKPENIMLRQKNKLGVKVIDLGSSCYEPEQFYTYIQSRFYRAPEIILGIRYTPAIDMWSFGCVLAQLLTGYPLFPGDSEQEQLMMFMEILGQPPTHLVQAGTRRKKFFNENFQCKIVKPNGKKFLPGSITLKKALNNCQSKLLVDLIARCLEWDSTKRITPKEALSHQWIAAALPQKLIPSQ